jgi:hypothetical protein
MATPASLYESEAWMMRKKGENRIQVAEMSFLEQYKDVPGKVEK